MLNLIEQTVRYLLARMVIRYSKISLRTEKFNLALTRVRKTKSHMIPLFRQVRFKSKIRETRFGNFS